MGSGCGLVGRAVASDARDPQLEFSHRVILFTFNCIEKTKKKERTGPLKFAKRKQ